MEIKKIWEKLLSMNSEIEEIFMEIGYRNNLLQSDIQYDDSNPNDCMLFDELYSIFTHFDYIHVVLNYLQLPIKEEGVLKSDGYGRYYVNKTEIKCGDTIEILLMDLNTNSMRWNILRLQKPENHIGEPARIRSNNMKKKCF